MGGHLISAHPKVSRKKPILKFSEFLFYKPGNLSKYRDSP